MNIFFKTFFYLFLFAGTFPAQGKDLKFNVEEQNGKYIFTLSREILGRDILIVSKLTRGAAGVRGDMIGYPGDVVNQKMIRFSKGKEGRIYLHRIVGNEVANDSSDIYPAFIKAHTLPITISFPILDSLCGNYRLDWTTLLKSDSDILFFDSFDKSKLSLGGLDTEKSSVSKIRAFPDNIEIRTDRTYNGSKTATLELSTTLLLLPEIPLAGRLRDPRVGYFDSEYVDYAKDPHGITKVKFVHRRRMRPRSEDMEKYRRGELVEPAEPIIFYIDPATPQKWVPYLIQGVNDWQKAFEVAGFKNAIYARQAPSPEENPSWSLEDIHNSTLTYKASQVANAMGTYVHDPRSGEILSSHINWHHNLMKMLRIWYFVQCAPLDELARQRELPDELMGQLIRFVSSHEVGHTLGLTHNYAASCAYPVEKLRDKEWLKENGHCSSIMDYSRFNYVAQPEDSIQRGLLFPRVNKYDKWAIEWGYRYYETENIANTELDSMTHLKNGHPHYRYIDNLSFSDPLSQSEDLGDNQIVANAYGIKNLKYITEHMPEWMANENPGYVKEMYIEVLNQYSRYVTHVTKYIGGLYCTPRRNTGEGESYRFVEREKQKQAINFLDKYLFQTPDWLFNYRLFQITGMTDQGLINSVQNVVFSHLITIAVMQNLLAAQTMSEDYYVLSEFLSDMDCSILTEIHTGKAMTPYRRNLQKNYIKALLTNTSISATNPMAIDLTQVMPGATNENDIVSIIRFKLKQLKKDCVKAQKKAKSIEDKAHLEYLAALITSKIAL